METEDGSHVLYTFPPEIDQRRMQAGHPATSSPCYDAPQSYPLAESTARIALRGDDSMLLVNKLGAHCGADRKRSDSMCDVPH